MRDAVSSRAAPQPAPFVYTAWAPVRGHELEYELEHETRARSRAAEPQCEPLLTTREREAVQQSAWFAALPLLLRHDLLRRCTVHRYRGGELVHADAHGVNIDAVACGAVAVSMGPGIAPAFDYLPQGTWLVDPGLLAGGERMHRVVAQGRTTIVSIGAADLAAAMSAHGELELALLRLAHARMLEQSMLLDELSSVGLDERLARWLLRLCERFGEEEGGGVRIAIDLKQDALAALVRASRARVNLHLKRMERCGIVAVERRMRVLDMASLAERARG